MPELLIDALGRPLRNLRISVTDRCNMRCRYCMPEEQYVWLPRASILTFEEIDRLAGIFSGLGVHKIRLTAGEPLLRHDLPALVRLLSRHESIDDLALTTNGILLAREATALREAGLRRVTVSLDTLRPERMLAFARSPRHDDVLAGISAASAAGFDAVKLHRVHGRGRGDAVGLRPCGLAARDPRIDQPMLRAGDPAPRGRLGTGGAVPAVGRHHVRGHRIDDGAVLPDL